MVQFPLKQLKPLQRTTVHYVRASFHWSTNSQSRWVDKEDNANLLDQLQPLLQVPLLREDQWVFTPSQAELQQAQPLFKERRDKKIISHKGVVDLKDLPKSHLPEVAFLGRSNVGKSSLMKALFYNPPDVKMSVSKQPGHTRSLKFYTIRKQFSLVDMPGYGYQMPEYFTSCVEEYLMIRQTLCRVFLLIDGQVGVTSTDHTALDMLEASGKPYVLVLTKVDKASHHRVIRNLWDIMKLIEQHLSACLPQPFLVSAHQDAGLGHLRAFIAYITGNLAVSGH